jgi:hypothetical protein
MGLTFKWVPLPYIDEPGFLQYIPQREGKGRDGSRGHIP